MSYLSDQGTTHDTRLRRSIYLVLVLVLVLVHLYLSPFALVVQ